MRRRSSRLRVLDFDVEARPLGWYGGDLTHKEVTVVAFKWIGESDDVEVEALSKDDRTRRRMLVALRRVYDEADMVVGHYIRGFDLPLVSAMLTELGESPLSQKLSHDTKNDLVKLHGVSKSQENLAAMLGVEEPKQHMNTQMWRESNRLTKTGVESGMDRARFDVLQNIALRDALMARGMLGPPKIWRPI